MTTVNVSYGETNPTHDISLEDIVGVKYGLIYNGGPRALVSSPLSPPAQQFDIQQKNWMSGRGFLRYADDNSGFNDSHFLWTTTDGKLFNAPQWQFASGIRTNEDTSLPGDNASMAWWKLYGNTPASRIARYLSIKSTAGFNGADKGYLWIKRVGTPGTLTFELCNDNAGAISTVITTVTKTVSDITDTVSVFQVFDWSSTQNLTTYWIKIYGASTDTVTNHWEVLGNASGTASKYSSDNTTWTASTISMYYRVTDADTARKWWFFILENAMYVVDTKDATANSVLLNNGLMGTATSGTGTTLVDTARSMVTNKYAGARIRIYDGTGDGQDREIASNDATSFTVATWDVNPDSTSKYYVYSTPYFATTTGTPGLGKVVGQPVTADKTAYFPQGTAVNMRRMYVAGASHTFADDGSNKYPMLYLNTDPATGVSVYGITPNTAAVKNAPTVAQGTNLTFANQKFIGSGDFRINRLFNYNGTLYIFKEDGPYKLNGSRVERPTSGFNDLPDPNTGLAVCTQDQYLWWGWGHSVIRTIGDDSTDMMNFRAGYEGLPADRRGVFTAAVSAVGWTFFAVDGGASNYSSVLCWNGYGWHEVFRGWAAGVRIRNIFWQPNVGARGRLWIDINGELVFMDFPLNAANPLKDTALNYHIEGVFTSSTIDANDSQFYKIFEDIKLLLDQGNIEVDYQTNAYVGTSAWTILGTASTSPMTEINLNLGQILKIRFRYRLQVTSSRTPTVLSGWMTSGRLMQPKKYQWAATFRVNTNQTTLTDEDDHNPNTLYTQLQTWAEQQYKLTLRTLDYSSDNKVVTISLPSKSVDYIDETDWGGRIGFSIFEV